MRSRSSGVRRMLLGATMAVSTIAGCSLDSAPIKPLQERNLIGPDAGSGNAGTSAAGASAAGTNANVGGMGAAGTNTAGMGAAGTGGAGTSGASDAGADAGSHADARVMDARTHDADAPDARMDADTTRDTGSGPDAAPDNDGGGKDSGGGDPDAGPDVDAGHDSGPTCDVPPPCYCPHEEPMNEGNCEAQACDFADCAPDTMCTYVSGATGKYYVCDNQRTWQVARQRCESQTDMLLVNIESEDEDDFLFSIIDDKVWAGGNDLGEENTWRWSDGTHFYTDALIGGGPVDDAYTNWDPAEPNNLGLNLGEANCLLLWFENLAWADATCSDMHGFICEVVP